MPEWFPLSLTALLLLGTQRFLYKVAVERGCSPPLTTAVFMGTVCLLSGTVFFLSGEATGPPMTLLSLALANSLSFALATLSHMEALKRLPATVTFPLTRLSVLVVVGYSVLQFDERPMPMQWLGILLGLAVVAVLSGEAGGNSRSRGKPWIGLLMIAVCIIGGAVASISSKLAALATSKTGFMALSYLLGTLFSLIIDRAWRREPKAAGTGPMVRIGMLMGLLNFCGYYAFLAALARGPLSLIALITSMHFVIAIVLSILVYRERLTFRRLCGLGLTLLALICLQL